MAQCFRVYAGRTAHRGGLGQGPADVMTLALSMTQPITIPMDWGKVSVNEGAIFVSKDGQQIAKSGAQVGNTQYWRIFPDDRRYFALFGLYGPNQGYLFFVPEDSLPTQWARVNPSIQTKVLSLLPIVGPITQRGKLAPNEVFSLESISTVSNRAYEWATQAKRDAELGDLDHAKSNLRIGLGDLDHLNAQNRILFSLGDLTGDQYVIINKDVILPLADALSKAGATVTELTGAPVVLKALAYLGALADTAALAMRRFASAEWDKALVAYRTLDEYNKSETGSIRQLEASAGDDPQRLTRVRELKTRLLGTRNAQTKLEGEFAALGLPVADVRKEAGLGVPWVIPIIGKALTVALVVAFIKKAVIFLIVNVILGLMLEAIILRLFGLQIVSKKEHEDLKKAADAGLLPTGDVGSLFTATQDGLNKARTLAKVANSPEGNAKVDELERALQKWMQEGPQGTQAVPQIPTSAIPPKPEPVVTDGATTKSPVYLWLGLGALGAGVLIYFLSKRK